MHILIGWAALCLSAAVASAGTTVLYNGALGTAPESQGYFETTTLGIGTETVASGSTTYDTSATAATYGGFSNYTASLTSPVLVNSSFPALNAAAGYSVDFNLQELLESHTSTSRAGLALIVLSSDQTGVELGFWKDTIFAQSSTFAHSEDVAFDTTARSANYNLTISGTSYVLSADGVAILNGSTRDYSLNGRPYNLSNYLFLGDDTTSAAGKFNFSSLSVTVPEPSTFSLLGISQLGLLLRKRLRST